MGSMVLVAFVNGDPARPVVVAGDDPGSPGFAPSRLDVGCADDLVLLGVGATGRALRYGDSHTCAYTGLGVPLTPDVLIPSVGMSRVRP